MDKPKIHIIFGSTRPNRKGEQVANWVVEQASAQKDFEVEFIDLRDWPLPFYNEVESVDDLDGKFSTDLATAWGEKLKEADGFIIVTPEYNHGYPAVLKNALDYAYYEWARKPIAFVSYGGSAGGARSVEQLRLVSLEFHMAPIGTSVNLVGFKRLFDENGKLKDPEKQNRRLGRLFEELLWWTRTLKAGRDMV